MIRKRMRSLAACDKTQLTIVAGEATRECKMKNGKWKVENKNRALHLPFCISGGSRRAFRFGEELMHFINQLTNIRLRDVSVRARVDAFQAVQLVSITRIKNDGNFRRNLVEFPAEVET